MPDITEGLSDNSLHEQGAGFSLGFILGLIVGGAFAYISFSPEGKKNAEEALEKALVMLEKIEKEAEEKVNSVSQQIQTVEVATNTQPEVSKNGDYKKRFFKKNGKKS